MEILNQMYSVKQHHNTTNSGLKCDKFGKHMISLTNQDKNFHKICAYNDLSRQLWLSNCTGCCRSFKVEALDEDVLSEDEGTIRLKTLEGLSFMEAKKQYKRQTSLTGFEMAQKMRPVDKE